MADQKVHPDYMYLNQVPDPDDSTIYFTDPKVQQIRRSKKRGTSMCVTLACFLLIFGIGVITFFVVAPMVRLTRGSYYQYRHEANRYHHDSDCPPGNHEHDDVDKTEPMPPHDIIKDPYHPSNRRSYPERPEPMYFDLLRGLSFRGKMCLRRCFRERREGFPSRADEAEKGEEHNERYIWALLIRHTEFKLSCLERCERFTFVGQPRDGVSPTPTPAPTPYPRDFFDANNGNDAEDDSPAPKPWDAKEEDFPTPRPWDHIGGYAGNMDGAEAEADQD